VNNHINKQAILIDEYDYSLPDERIAKFPLPRRDASKLLIYKNDTIIESTFSNIADFLPENCLLVYNNTRVIHARLVFHKETGARIEVFCLEPLTPADYAQSLGSTTQCVWKCMVGNLKKWKDGLLSKQIEIEGKNCIFNAEFIETKRNMHSIRFTWNNADVHFADILEKAGEGKAE